MKVYLIFNGSIEIEEYEYHMLANEVTDKNGAKISKDTYLLFTSESHAKESQKEIIIKKIKSLQSEIISKTNEIAILASKI